MQTLEGQSAELSVITSPFLRVCLIVFQSACSILHAQEAHMEVPVRHILSLVHPWDYLRSGGSEVGPHCGFELYFLTG